MSAFEIVLIAYAVVLAGAVIAVVARMIIGPTILDRALSNDALVTLVVMGMALYAAQSEAIWAGPAMLGLTGLAFIGTVTFARFVAREEPIRHQGRVPRGPSTETGVHEAIHLSRTDGADAAPANTFAPERAADGEPANTVVDDEFIATAAGESADAPSGQGEDEDPVEDPEHPGEPFGPEITPAHPGPAEDPEAGFGARPDGRRSDDEWESGFGEVPGIDHDAERGPDRGPGADAGPEGTEGTR